MKICCGCMASELFSFMYRSPAKPRRGGYIFITYVSKTYFVSNRNAANWFPETNKS